MRSSSDLNTLSNSELVTSQKQFAQALESAGMMVNDYCKVKILPNHSEKTMAKVNQILITTLDQFLKDQFMLNVFAKDYANHEAVFEERFKMKNLNREPLFSDYRHFIGNNTYAYLISFYPDDFL